VKISESCSCGASIKLDDANAVRLVREWRKKHNCSSVENDEVSAVHGGSSDNQVSTIGFMATGIYDPPRSPYPEEDE
jgi:hypothetical protein